MGVAPHLAGQARRQAVVGLPQGDPGLAGQRHQRVARPLVETAVGRMRDGLLHHCRVHRDLRQAALRHGTRGAARLDGFGQQPLRPLLADPAAPAAERGGVDGRAVLEEDLTREVLEVGVLHPAGEHRLVGQAVGVLQHHQPGNQPRMRRRPPLAGGEEAGSLPLEPRPVD